jgi:16S rRNA (uracil1498-N3)-methyltransferase
MQLFFEPNILQNQCLSEEESRHAVRVLRMREADKLSVLDGLGNKYECSVTKAHEKRCEIKILTTESRPKAQTGQIHLVIAPTKNLDRIEWMIEKCVEIGLEEISFVQCKYSERKELKTERLRKIMVAAMKQSQQYFLPKLNEMVTLSRFLERPNDEQKYVAYLGQERHELKDSIKKQQNHCILIGPEGDFSHEEVAQAIKAGFLPVSLGESRLRTETAGLVAVHTLKLLC